MNAKQAVLCALISFVLTSYSSNNNYVNAPTGAVIKSPAGARGVHNVDCCLSEVDQIDLIESKVCVIDQTIDDVQSKVCVVESKVDELVNPCMPTPIIMAGTPTAPTPITGPVTLSESGHYCLSADLDVSSGDAIVITGTNVTLDLNGYTISGGGYADHGIIISGQNAEVFNGTIQGMSGSGVYVTGDKNSIHNVIVQESTIGFELLQAQYNTIVDSKALCATQAGFSLENSMFNTFERDAALGTSGDGDVFGFVSRGGQGNRFIQSLAQDTQSSATYDGLLVAGFSLQNGERCSEICDSTANKTHLTDPYSASTAIGFHVEKLETADNDYYLPEECAYYGMIESESNAISMGRLNQTAKWLEYNGRYFVAYGGANGEIGGVPKSRAGGGTTANVAIAEYDPVTDTLTLLPYAVYDFVMPADILDPDDIYSNIFDVQTVVKDLDWVICDDKIYLAAGGQSGFNLTGGTFSSQDLLVSYTMQSEVVVLEFDPEYETLTERALFDHFDNYLYSLDMPGSINYVAWLPGTKFLAISGTENAEANAIPIRILEFDAAYDTLTEVDNADVELVSGGVAWLSSEGEHYLATSGGDTIHIYSFDTGTKTLTEETTATFTGLNSPTSGWFVFDWTIFNGQKYLAVGSRIDDVIYEKPQVQIYRFDSYSNTLNFLSNANYEEIVGGGKTSNPGVQSVDWIQVGNCCLLTVASGIASSPMGGQPGYIYFLELDGTTEALSNKYLSGASLFGIAQTNLTEARALYVNDLVRIAYSYESEVFAPTIFSTSLLDGPFFVDVPIVELNVQAFSNIIKNNLAQGTTGGAGAYGFCINNDLNFVFKNSACQNTVNYLLTGTQTTQDQIVASQQDAGAFENVDCDLPNENTVVLALCAPKIIHQSDIPYTITTAGHYIVAEDLSLSADGSVIVVDSSHVSLNLCGHTISATSASLTVTGVSISESNSFVSVSNGVIDTVNTGIAILGNTSSISVHDLTMRYCASHGITILSSDVGPTNKVIIEKCCIENSGSGVYGLMNTNEISTVFISECVFEFLDYSAIHFQGYVPPGAMSIFDVLYVQNVHVSDCVMRHCQTYGGVNILLAGICNLIYVSNITMSRCTLYGNPDLYATYAMNSSSGVNFIGAFHVVLTDVTISGEYRATFYGVSFSATSNITCSSVLITSNIGYNNFRGISMNDTTNGVFRDCIVSGNNSVSADLTAAESQVGYYVDKSSCNEFVNCKALNNGAKGSGLSLDLSAGFYFDRSMSFSNNITDKTVDNRCISCVASGQVGRANIFTPSNYSEGVGFLVGKASPNTTLASITFLDCIAEHNQAFGYFFDTMHGITVVRCIANRNGGTGFLFEGDTSDSEIKDCQAISNGVHGFFTKPSSSANVLFIRNIACHNPASLNTFIGPCSGNGYL